MNTAIRFYFKWSVVFIKSVRKNDERVREIRIKVGYYVNEIVVVQAVWL